MHKTLILWGALALFTLTACSEFRERLDGYPTEDLAIDKATATPNEIADALNRIARMTLIGDDWEFEDQNDHCTLTVVEGDTRNARILSLQSAAFEIHRDPLSEQHYATIQNDGQAVRDRDGSALRLFETHSYHSLSIAEGYLIALAKKCTDSLEPKG